MRLKFPSISTHLSNSIAPFFVELPCNSPMPEYLGGRLFCFSGQGSGYFGMGAAVGEDPFFAAAYRELEAVLLAENLRVPQSYWLGNGSELPSPIDENLCLLTYQLALARKFAGQGYRPSGVTAHSFGEFAALAFCGILSFAEVIKVVCLRERACGERNESGYLVTARLPVESAERLAGSEGVHIASRNGETLFTFACEWQGLLRLEDELRRFHHPFRRLPIAQAYHSPYLRSARERMADWISATTLSPQQSRVPFFSSLRGEWIDGMELGDAGMKQLLCDQLTRPIDFLKQMRAIDGQRCEVIEIAPTAVLRQAVCQIQQKSSGGSYQLAEAGKLVHAPSLHSSPSFKKSTTELVNRVLSRVTGYSIEDIHLGDRFQEDLGIDSLKAMEIVVQVAKESSVPINPAQIQQLRTVRDLADWVENPVRPFGQMESALGNFGLRDKFDFGIYEPRLFPLLPSTFLTTPTPKLFSWKELVSTHFKEESGEVIALLFTPEDQLPEVRDLVNLSRWLTAAGSPKVVLIDSEQAGAVAQVIAVFLRSWQKEGGLESVQSFTFEGIQLPPDWAEAASILLGSPNVGHLCRSGVKWAFPSWQRSEGSSIPQSKKKTAEECWVALGGGSGILYSLLRRHPNPNKVRLFILGRREISDPRVGDALGQLRTTFRSVHYTRCDATQLEELRAALREITEIGGQIDRFIHSAGEEHSRSLALYQPGENEGEYAPRIRIAQNLVRLSSEFPIQSVILFSSVIALFGNRGQTLYAAGHRAAEGVLSNLPGTTWYWPPWDRIGMTQSDRVAASLDAAGVGLISEAAAAELFYGHQEHASKNRERLAVLSTADLALYELPLHPACSFLGRDEWTQHGGYRALDIGVEFRAQKDHWLRDHIVGELSLLPAAVALAGAHALGRKLSFDLPVVHRFELLGPMIVAEGSARLRFSLRGLESIVALSVISLGKSSGEVGRAVLELNPGEQRQGESCPGFVRPRGPSVSQKQLYRRDRLFHGESMRFLKKVWGLQENDHTWAAVDGLVVSGFRSLGGESTLVALCDSAFQLLAVRTLQNSRAFGLPIACDRFEVLTKSTLPTNGLLLLKNWHEVTQGAEALVEYFDLEGRPLLRWSQLQLRYITSNGKFGTEG